MASTVVTGRPQFLNRPAITYAPPANGGGRKGYFFEGAGRASYPLMEEAS